jgi:hypothetical protein
MDELALLAESVDLKFQVGDVAQQDVEVGDAGARFAGGLPHALSPGVGRRSAAGLPFQEGNADLYSGICPLAARRRLDASRDGGRRPDSARLMTARSGDWFWG